MGGCGQNYVLLISHSLTTRRYFFLYQNVFYCQLNLSSVLQLSFSENWVPTLYNLIDHISNDMRRSYLHWYKSYKCLKIEPRQSGPAGLDSTSVRCTYVLAVGTEKCTHVSFLATCLHFKWGV